MGENTPMNALFLHSQSISKGRLSTSKLLQHCSLAICVTFTLDYLLIEEEERN